MIDDIFEKFDLLKNKRKNDFSEQTNEKIIAIPTFGRDKPIIEVTKKFEGKFPSIRFQKINKPAFGPKKYSW